MITPTPIKIRKRTKVIEAVDRSGSMQPIRRPTVDAVNAQVDSVREGAADTDQDADFTLITFGGDERFGFNVNYDPHYVGRRVGGPSEYPPVCIHFEQRDIRQVDHLTMAEYVPDGGTPLLSAIGVAIDVAKRSGAWNDPNTAFLFHIVTDGAENTSRRFDELAIRRLVREALATDRCTFAFSVPDERARQLLIGFGIPAGCVQTWAQTDEGAAEMSRTTSLGTRSFFEARAKGATKTDKFYVDASQLTKTEVVQNLDDISGKVKIWKVEAEAVAKDFVESHGRKYVIGALFYKLTKPETLQEKKVIAVRKIGEKAIYAGDAARDLLGLPRGVRCKVTPGNLGQWEVFVQSTSVNRKLVRGTEVLYRLDITQDLAPTWDHVGAEKAAVEKQRGIMKDKTQPLVDRVWAAIRCGYTKASDIMREVGTDGDMLDSMLKRLKADNRVKYVDRKVGWQVIK